MCSFFYSFLQPLFSNGFISVRYYRFVMYSCRHGFLIYSDPRVYSVHFPFHRNSSTWQSPSLANKAFYHVKLLIAIFVFIYCYSRHFTLFVRSLHSCLILKVRYIAFSLLEHLFAISPVLNCFRHLVHDILLLIVGALFAWMVLYFTVFTLFCFLFSSLSISFHFSFFYFWTLFSSQWKKFHYLKKKCQKKLYFGFHKNHIRRNFIF